MKTKQIIIPRISNDIQELLISYGLFSILLDMDYGFDVKLKRKKGAYIIDLEEEIETSDIYVVPTENDTAIENLRFNSMTSKTNFNYHVNKLYGAPDEFGDFSGGYLTDETDNLDRIFSYYSTLNLEYIKDFPNLKTSYLHGIYTGKGVRSNGGPTSFTLNMAEYCLSTMGYYRATSFASLENKGNEFTWLAVPSENGVSYLNKWHPYSYVDKDTGEVVYIYYLRNSSETVTSATLKVKMQLEISMLENLEEFVGFYEIQVAPTMQRPLNDKVTLRTWLDVSEELLDTLNKLFSYSTTDYAIKESISRYINFRDNYNYSNMVQTIAKNSEFPLFTIREAEEIAKMVNKQNLLEVKAIQDYANMLKLFMWKDKGIGYQVQKDLLSVNNVSKLMSALTVMNVSYARKYNNFKVDSESLKELFSDVVDGNNHVTKDVANAILMLSTVKSEKALEVIEKEISEESSTETIVQELSVETV